MKTLWELAESEQRRIVYVFLLMIAFALAALCGAFFLKIIFDRIFKESEEVFNFSGISILLFGMLSFIAFRTVLWEIREWIFGKSIIHLDNAWPQKALVKLLSLSTSYHERENTGKKITRIREGCNKSVEMLAKLFWEFLPSCIMVILSIGMITIVDWKLGLLFLLPFVPTVFLVYRFYEEFSDRWEKWSNMNERSMGFFCQGIVNVRTVQSFNREEFEIQRFENIRRKMFDLDLAIFRAQRKYYCGIRLLLDGFFVGVIWLGLFFVSKDLSSIGSIVFIVASGSVAVDRMFPILQSYSDIMRYIERVNRLDRVLQNNEVVDDLGAEHAGDVLDPTISFIRVHYAYQKKQSEAIKDISFHVKKGEMIAIVGKSGSGKSTLMKLIQRFSDPTSGEIRFGGIPIRKLRLGEFRRQFAYMPQTMEIFDSSIAENVRYGNPEASEDEIRRALHAAYFLHEIEDKNRFPDGIWTEIGERGVRLSGGEQQRVGIARSYLAIHHSARVLLLDEATSSLDSESEKAIQRMIEERRAKDSLTIIAIAHRLSTIQAADTIIVLDQGKIIETGNHDSLLRKNGLYRRLAELQGLGEIR